MLLCRMQMLQKGADTNYDKYSEGDVSTYANCRRNTKA